MRLDQFLDQLKDLPPDTRVCVAEIDEAFAINIASVEIIDNAHVTSDEPSGQETVELGAGDDRVVVIRW